MAGKKSRSFDCRAIREVVQIHLRNQRVGGFGGHESSFVQCDQAECQYVDENRAPCPLRIEMFADEIKARDERTRQRHDSAY